VVSQPVLLALGLGVGAVMALYLPLVGTMGRALGSPVLAAVPFFVVGLVTAVLASLATGHAATAARFRELDWWLPLAGVGAFLMIVGSAYLIPQIGASVFFVVLVAGQLAVGAAVAHYGLLGSATVPLDLTKAIGLLLVVAGAYLAVR
jgi:transporter family-2 protein